MGDRIVLAELEAAAAETSDIAALCAALCAALRRAENALSALAALSGDWPSADLAKRELSTIYETIDFRAAPGAGGTGAGT